MKKLNQHLLLAATMLLMAGSAYAQAPTNTYQGQPIRPVATPTNTHMANAEVTGASAGTYSKDYNVYSQDSYVSQTGSNNYATVDQSDSRTYSKGNGAGSTAILNQTGDNNNATQRQSVSDQYEEFATGKSARNFMKSTQDGSKSQTDQTQNGGKYNVMTVVQGTSTTGNRAIQNQSSGGSFYGDRMLNSANQAVINQTVGSGNRAEQIQDGIYETAQIDQESSKSYAKQMQTNGLHTMGSNTATIHQGSPGSANTAMQMQRDGGNIARIQQSVGSAGSNNYALQNQSMDENQADITQQSSGNYAEQQQSGITSAGGFNYSSITQSNVASAAYTTQSGNSNTVIITQH